MAVEELGSLDLLFQMSANTKAKLGWTTITNLTIDDRVLRILEVGSFNGRDHTIIRQRGRHVWELSINELIRIVGRIAELLPAADGDAANARESEMQFEGR